MGDVVWILKSWDFWQTVLIKMNILSAVNEVNSEVTGGITSTALGLGGRAGQGVVHT